MMLGVAQYGTAIARPASRSRPGVDLLAVGDLVTTRVDEWRDRTTAGRRQDEPKMLDAAAASKAVGPKDIGRCATEMLGDSSRPCPAVVL